MPTRIFNSTVELAKSCQHRSLGVTSFPVVPTIMTLNDPEPEIKGLCDFFSRFWAVMHISRLQCAKMTGDRSRQPA